MRLMSAGVAGALLLPAVAVLGPGAAPAQAEDFVPGPGTYTVDTDDLVISGPGGGDVGRAVGGVAVFDFDDVVVGPGVTMNVVGSRPVRFEARGRMDVRGIISGRGGNATDFGGGAVSGGPGGGAGGAPNSPGSGPGGGGAASSSAGAGGGGYGGRGAQGGGPGAGAAGPAYAGLPSVLRGGSGGGGGPLTSGGGGGGAVELRAAQLTIAPGAVVTVDGGGGAVAGGGATGGGSGGGLLLRADRLSVNGSLQARGGDGGIGGCCGHGGGGGGGRITLIGRLSLDLTTVPLVNGGTSGVRSTSACCAGGTAGPDPTGVAGKLVQIRGTSLTASANRTVTPGTRVTFSTRLRSFTTPLAGRTVTLWRRPPTGSTWQRVATRTTSGSGVASASLRVSASGRYQWRFAGAATYLPSVSPQSTVTVRR